MNYKETVDFLFNQFPAFQKDGSSAYKPGLSRILELSDMVGNPHQGLRCVHLAGTNGKGSTSHLLASVLQEAGYKVGLFTSPHLIDFRERIKINGKEIPEEEVVKFVGEFSEKAQAIQPSFFEYTTVMAFDYFKKQLVDIAIIETGLGGRLDCSNIVLPEVSVITNIGMDHVQFLGNTLTDIAKEKAGIIKGGVPVVVGRKQGETVTVFDYFAHQMKTSVTWAEEVNQPFETDLKGIYQLENSKTALATIYQLQLKGWKIKEEHIKAGFINTVRNTGLRGRWQQIGEQPKIICDTGHNEDGIQQVTKQLTSERYDRLHIVWGMVNDKDASKILRFLPKDASYYWCSPKNNRALNVEVLSKYAESHQLNGQEYSSVEEAFRAAKLRAGVDDFIYVGGSTFVVAEVVR